MTYAKFWVSNSREMEIVLIKANPNPLSLPGCGEGDARAKQDLRSELSLIHVAFQKTSRTAIHVVVLGMIEHEARNR